MKTAKGVLMNSRMLGQLLKDRISPERINAKIAYDRHRSYPNFTTVLKPFVKIGYDRYKSYYNFTKGQYPIMKFGYDRRLSYTNLIMVVVRNKNEPMQFIILFVAFQDGILCKLFELICFLNKSK